MILMQERTSASYLFYNTFSTIQRMPVMGKLFHSYEQNE